MTARVDHTQVLDILSRARALIATKGWCQQSPARDRYDAFVFETDGRAVKFSALGAIFRCATELGIGWADATTSRAVRALHLATAKKDAEGNLPPATRAQVDVADWNDALDAGPESRALVVTRFTAAIAEYTKSIPQKRTAVPERGVG